tara:strand:- start:6795 stop:7286 length:492 start_codon:yes stop_codon:yes gene_type:complete
MNRHPSKPASDYEKHIGRKVSKKSGKPFKGGRTRNTIKGIMEHPEIHVPAYTFYEDDSYVACSWCVVNEVETESPQLSILSDQSGLRVTARKEIKGWCFEFYNGTKPVKTVYTYKKAKMFADGVAVGRELPPRNPIPGQTQHPESAPGHDADCMCEECEGWAI